MSPSSILLTVADQHARLRYPNWPLAGSNISRHITESTIEVEKSKYPGTAETNQRYEVANGLLSFDTGSALPDEAIILGAKLVLTMFPSVNTDSRSLSGEYYTWDGMSPSDVTATDSATAFDGVALSSWTAPTTVQSFNLKSLQANISSTGTTKIRLHVTGGEPTGENVASFAAFEHPVYQHPRLVVQYIAPPLYVGSSSAFATGATAVVVNKPAGVVQGDYMICVLGVRGGTGQTITPPSGWTLYAGSRVNITTVVAGAIYTKTAGASEPTSYSFGYSASDNASAEIVAYRNLTATQIEVLSSQTNTASTSVTAPAVTNQYVADRLLTVGIQPVTAATVFDPPAGMTERVEQSG